jgi:hypothetical protein
MEGEEVKIDKQLQEWVDGNSIHNKEIDECCPDFSCCNKKIYTPKNVKEKFVKAIRDDDYGTKRQMLTEFLNEAVKGKNVYVAGLSPMPEEKK